eukprot:Hpha_TRINITY_DN16428_c2_g5::TRINITY_DN16428_c2_g5_i1::g.163113::m.163113
MGWPLHTQRPGEEVGVLSRAKRRALLWSLDTADLTLCSSADWAAEEMLRSLALPCTDENISAFTADAREFLASRPSPTTTNSPQAVVTSSPSAGPVLRPRPPQLEAAALDWAPGNPPAFSSGGDAGLVDSEVQEEAGRVTLPPFAVNVLGTDHMVDTCANASVVVTIHAVNLSGAPCEGVRATRNRAPAVRGRCSFDRVTLNPAPQVPFRVVCSAEVSLKRPGQGPFPCTLRTLPSLPMFVNPSSPQRPSPPRGVWSSSGGRLVDIRGDRKSQQKVLSDTVRNSTRGNFGLVDEDDPLAPFAAPAMPAIRPTKGGGAHPSGVAPKQPTRPSLPKPEHVARPNGAVRVKPEEPRNPCTGVPHRDPVTGVVSPATSPESMTSPCPGIPHMGAVTAAVAPEAAQAMLASPNPGLPHMTTVTGAVAPAASLDAPLPDRCASPMPGVPRMGTVSGAVAPEEEGSPHPGLPRMDMVTVSVAPGAVIPPSGRGLAVQSHRGEALSPCPGVPRMGTVSGAVAPAAFEYSCTGAVAGTPPDSPLDTSRDAVSGAVVPKDTMGGMLLSTRGMPGCLSPAPGILEMSCTGAVAGSPPDSPRSLVSPEPAGPRMGTVSGAVAPKDSQSQALLPAAAGSRPASTARQNSITDNDTAPAYSPSMVPSVAHKLNTSPLAAITPSPADSPMPGGIKRMKGPLPPETPDPPESFQEALDDRQKSCASTPTPMPVKIRSPTVEKESEGLAFPPQVRRRKSDRESVATDPKTPKDPSKLEEPSAMRGRKKSVGFKEQLTPRSVPVSAKPSASEDISPRSLVAAVDADDEDCFAMVSKIVLPRKSARQGALLLLKGLGFDSVDYLADEWATLGDDD